MAEDSELALVLARTVAHELGNLLQPLATALRYAKEAPEQVSAHLEMASEALTGCLAVAERLRTASFAGGERRPFSMADALEEAREGLPAEQQGLLRLSISSRAPEVTGDRGAAVLALIHLLGHAAEATAGKGPIEVQLGEAGVPVVIRFGGPSPARDDPPPPMATRWPSLRSSTGLSMGWILAVRAMGPGALRVGQGSGSGRIELGSAGE